MHHSSPAKIIMQKLLILTDQQFFLSILERLLLPSPGKAFAVYAAVIGLCNSRCAICHLCSVNIVGMPILVKGFISRA